MKPSLLTRLLSLLVVLTLAVVAFAAPPQTINYQGYLKNTAGTPVSSETTIRFSLYSSNPPRNDNYVWRETKSITPSNGIYSTQFGSVAPITAPFDVPYWLGVKVAGDAEMALQTISSVPYAYRASRSDSVTNNSIGTGAIADGSVTAAKLDTAYVKQSGDTMTGTLNISSGNLTLPATSTTGGIISFGGGRYFHAYGIANIFAGPGAGNLTMTGSNNTAIGTAALGSNSTGSNNMASGAAALWVNSTGEGNTAAGAGSLFNVSSGSGNTALGSGSGSSQTTGSNNIYIGAGVGGFAGESNVTRIGNDQIQQAYIAGTVNADRIVATVPTGTPPLQVNSTTQVNNLNAEMVGGKTLSSLDSRYAITRTQVPTAEQITTLRWDLAKQGNEFGCGGDPRGIAFDGTYLWVANYTANTVTRVRPGDGVKVDSFPVGTNPVSVAFDGSDIWVVNYGSNNVTRLRASDGSTVATYDMGVGAAPMGIAFDGSAMWVTNNGASTVTRINATTGTMTSFMTSTGPYGVVFDGDKIWVACSGFNNVLSYRISDGFNSATISVGASPRWLAFDGTYIWVTNNSDGTVTRFQASDGSNATSFSVGSFPTGIAFDGRAVWVAASGIGGVVKLRAADGLNQGTYLVNGTPRRLVFDGSSIWVSVGGLDKLVKLVDAGVAPVPLGVGTGGLADNAVNTGKLMDNSVTSAKIADGAVTDAKIADGATSSIKIADSAVTTTKIANASVTAAKLDTAYVKLAGDTMTGQLNLPASGVKIGNSYGAITESWWEFGKNDGVTGTGIDFHGGSTLTDFTARLHRVAGDNGDFQIVNYGTGSLSIYTGGYTPRLTILDNGNVGIGTTGPGSKLTVGPTLTGTPLSSTFVSNAGALGTAAGNVLNLANLGFTSYNHTSLGIKARRNSAGTDWQTSAIGLSFDVDNTSPVNNAQIWMTAAGNVGIGTTSPTQKLDVTGNFIKVTGGGGEQAYIGGDGVGGDVQIGSMNSGVSNITMYNPTSGQYMTVYLRDIQVMGGADLAEPFKSVDTNKLMPGMLVVIDTENPGHLILADKSYDKKVAGIVSGANGIRPGVTMGQEGTAASGTVPVALSGRVYAWADASYGAIEPGDLLTTSDTAGHAMKVTDHARAQGACIGKAMSRLSEGTGFVLVLVSLQ